MAVGRWEVEEIQWIRSAPRPCPYRARCPTSAGPSACAFSPEDSLRLPALPMYPRQEYGELTPSLHSADDESWRRNFPAPLTPVGTRLGCVFPTGPQGPLQGQAPECCPALTLRRSLCLLWAKHRAHCCRAKKVVKTRALLPKNPRSVRVTDTPARHYKCDPGEQGQGQSRIQKT